MAKFSFERAMEEIERINDSLSSAQTSLEESLKLFERGSKLINQCQAELTKYDRRIKILTGDNHLLDFKVLDEQAEDTVSKNN